MESIFDSLSVTMCAVRVTPGDLPLYSIPEKVLFGGEIKLINVIQKSKNAVEHQFGRLTIKNKKI